MAGVRQSDTAPETAVGICLRSLGLHYRKNVKVLPGSPDFANQSAKWAVFVHGCFWHHHSNCRKATIPKTNTEFWTGKFHANRKRDALAIARLRTKGYRVVLVWECQTHAFNKRLQKVLKARGIERR
jgi:DNA mismatch endonuclease Vsr